MNYWYVATPRELFLDIDNVSRSIKHAKSRLQGAIECGKLDVAYVMQRPSKSKDHLHVIITLNENDSPPRLGPYLKYRQSFHGPMKFIWEILLHGDIYRGCANMARWHYSIPARDILISPWKWFTGTTVEQVRYPDDHCECKSKHNAATMRDCPAAKRLRGEFRNVGFFGKPSKNPCTIWPGL
jgi:hypothetical protein